MQHPEGCARIDTNGGGCNIVNVRWYLKDLKKLKDFLQKNYTNYLLYSLMGLFLITE